MEGAHQSTRLLLAAVSVCVKHEASRARLSMSSLVHLLQAGGHRLNFRPPSPSPSLPRADPESHSIVPSAAVSLCPIALFYFIEAGLLL
mmetsp:Transcript_7742/g.24184  ORF Transcript_7742/g.24184 Transcript_7742/m.24184 type:complete len:89 (-) Transcript_7742:311-577(-)|eukprot:scaffold268305_cov32-Tisochrysis_lutea.AAC.2